MKKNILITVFLTSYVLSLAGQQTSMPVSAYTIAQRLLTPITLTGYQGIVNSAQFSPDGTKIVAVSPDDAKIWDAQTSQLLHTLQGSFKIAQFSLDGTKIYTSSGNGTVKIWNVQTGSREAHTTTTTLALSDTDAVISAQFSPDGTMIVTSLVDGIAKIWNARTGLVLKTLTYSANVESAQFSPDGTKVVTTSNFYEDRSVKIWDVKTGNLLRTLTGFTGEIKLAQFSPDGTKIVVSDGRTTRTWDIRTGELLRILAGHPNIVNSAQFSPDGTRIVTASDDKTVRIWDIRTRKSPRTFVYNDRIYIAHISPNGIKIITGSPANNVAKIRDIFSDIIGTYFSDKKLPLQQQVLLVILDLISKQNNGGPITMSDLVNPEGAPIDTAQLFKGLPADVVQALKIHYNIAADVIA